LVRLLDRGPCGRTSFPKTPPDGLIAEAFVLKPLGPEHNEADRAPCM
jgi:hypothetical protein